MSDPAIIKWETASLLPFTTLRFPPCSKITYKTSRFLSEEANRWKKHYTKIMQEMFTALPHQFSPVPWLSSSDDHSSSLQQTVFYVNKGKEKTS